MLNVEERQVQLTRLFTAGVDAVGGRQATERALQQHELSDQLYLVALGKASDAMAIGALSVMGERLVKGLIVTKHDHLSDTVKSDSRLVCYESGHPVPDENSLLAGAAVREFIAGIPEDAQLVVLISGGTSALVEHLNDGLTLDDLRRETDSLLASGAPIGDMNKLRKTLSQIKGGKLAKWVKCNTLQLLVSDVPGDRPSDIGSGLLVPDENTGMDKDLPLWDKIHTEIIASSTIAQNAVTKAAEAQDLVVQQSSGVLHGEMEVVVNRLKDCLCDPDIKPGVYVWGGEPTVVLPEHPGRGGRNQHLALAAAEFIGRSKIPMSLLVCGTDGTDGPTNDAGGLVDENTLKKALESDLSISDHLLRADAGTALEKLGALITTGPTGTNVMDLAIAIVGTKE